MPRTTPSDSLPDPLLYPPSLQVPPTVDNMLENVGVLTAAALGLPPDALLNTHRLDVGTSGVVVLAKSSAFAAWFTGLLKNKPGFVVKTYRCLTAAPPPVGPMVDWAVVKQREKGEPAHTRILLECAVPDPHSSSSGSSSGGGGEDGDAAAQQAGIVGAVRCELIVQQVCEAVLHTPREACKQLSRRIQLLGSVWSLPQLFARDRIP